MANLNNNTVIRDGSSTFNGTKDAINTAKFFKLIYILGTRYTRWTQFSNDTVKVAAAGYWLTTLGPLRAVSQENIQAGKILTCICTATRSWRWISILP
jgi:hypothetical protein